MFQLTLNYRKIRYHITQCTATFSIPYFLFKLKIINIPNNTTNVIVKLYYYRFQKLSYL